MMLKSVLGRSTSTVSRAVVAQRFSAAAFLSKHAAAAKPAAHPEGVKSLKQRVSEQVPKLREEFATFKKEHGNKVLGTTTVSAAVGGMRGIKGLLSETSLLDAEHGIMFRGGYSIPDLQRLLPKAPNGGSEPKPEGVLWLLLTGEVPTAAEVEGVTRELQARAALPERVIAAINAFPKDMHPMTQLCAAVLMLQPESHFARQFAAKEVNKNNMWEPILEDSLTLIARLPEVAARIYRNTFHDGRLPHAPDASLDWSANFAKMMGYESPQFAELMRLYLSIHSDHELGNVSAHATHLVGSALADPYLSYTAGMAGLAGPLHGLANQQVVEWLFEFREQYFKDNADPTTKQMEEACWATLNAGHVIPGYGHAVLRRTDPRYTCQREFALKHLPNDPLFKLVSKLYDVVPRVLTEHGKTQNPWPNVDAHSGVLLQHYGLTEMNFYTVLFGVSRAIGVLSNLTLARIMGLPIERPKSMTMEYIRKHN